MIMEAWGFFVGGRGCAQGRWRRGFLRCAAHDEAVSSYGRNDDPGAGLKTATTVEILAEKARRAVGESISSGSFAALRMTARTDND